MERGGQSATEAARQSRHWRQEWPTNALMIKKHKQGFGVCVGVCGGVSQSERGGQIRPESLWIEEQWFPTVVAHRINQELYKRPLPMICSRNSDVLV